MDRHSLVEATVQEVADAHCQDLTVQERFGVKYHTYWFNPSEHAVFCLAEGPDKASLVRVHEDAHGLLADKLIEVDPSMLEALMGVLPTHPAGTAYTASAMRAILFTDMLASTSTTSRLGDNAAMELVRSHDEIVRRLLAEHGGRYVKHTGDGAMASFNSVTAAVQTAIAILSELDLRNQQAEEPVQVRIGVSAGEPIEDGDDLFGSTVQLAARLCSWAPAGGIAVSGTVHDLCLGKQIPFKKRRTVQLKGFTERQHVFEIELHPATTEFGSPTRH
jgi:class 3 adenylate cyclase